MCGRYYVDPDTEDEIRKIVNTAEEKIKIIQGDVFPSQRAAVITSSSNGLYVGRMAWGFPGYVGKGLVINARAETAPEKPMFRDAMASRRCAVPAAGFYEWNRRKEKFRFWREGVPVLYLAGCYDQENRFVILTTDANSSVAPVHDRMPVILSSDELRAWLGESSGYMQLLHRPQPALQSGTDYQQLSLF